MGEARAQGRKPRRDVAGRFNGDNRARTRSASKGVFLALACAAGSEDRRSGQGLLGALAGSGLAGSAVTRRTIWKPKSFLAAPWNGSQ